MLGALKQIVDSLLGPVPDGTNRAHRVPLATAVLLVEVMKADADVGVAERKAVVEVLRHRFGLDDEELRQLLMLAERSQREATDFHAFTSALNMHLDAGQKLQVIEAMWQVAYADGELVAHEKHVLWRISDLLHVPHGAYIGAKMRAKAAAGLG